jgi:hypothetical protein
MTTEVKTVQRDNWDHGKHQVTFHQMRTTHCTNKVCDAYMEDVLRYSNFGQLCEIIRVQPPGEVFVYFNADEGRWFTLSKLAVQMANDPEFIKRVEQGRKDVEEGRVKILEQVKKDLGDDD